MEKEEKEKLLQGLVEKALQRVVGVVEMHSLRRNLHHPQVEEEVAVAGLWGRMKIKATSDHLLLLARRALEGIAASRITESQSGLGWKRP